MSFNVATLQALEAEGLDLAACIRVLSTVEPKPDTAAERRRAWDRDRKAEKRAEAKSGGMSGGSPPAIGSNDIDILTSREELPQEANASLPQGAKHTKTAVLWPCPAGVNPRHWADFLAARKRKRCVSTQTALDGVLADIARIADDDWPPGRLVEHAAAKGWASINDPRSDYGKRPHSDRPSNWETALRTNLGQGGYG